MYQYKIIIIFTPYVMYGIGIGLIISCIWEKGQEARKKLGLFTWFCATVLMGMLIWPMH